MAKKMVRAGLSEQVALSLEGDFAQGKYPPGARFPTEMVLAEQYGVSRTVVREAVKILQAKGFVETRQGSGTVSLGYRQNASIFDMFGDKYRRPDSIELDQAFQVTDLLFGFVVELALPKLDAKTLGAMRAKLDKAQNTRDLCKIADLQPMLMNRLAAVGGNELNIRLAQATDSYFGMANRILLKSTEDHEFLFHSIEEVLNALEAGEAQAAVKAHALLQTRNRQMIEALINKSYPKTSETR